MDSPNGSVPVEADEKPGSPARADFARAVVAEPNGVEPATVSTTGFPATRSPASGTAPSQPQAPATPLWLMRIWLVIRVAFFVELGMVLVVLPWTRGWTENSLLLAYPEVRLFVQNNFVRGLISGLGFLDIGFGVWEAVRYKEPPRSRKLS
jgi:hypothetical protein